MNKQKLLKKISTGSKNIRFNDLISCVEAFGFILARTKGSHFIFSHPVVEELLNLQNVNGQAKPYQMRQFLILIERYNLKMEETG